MDDDLLIETDRLHLRRYRPDDVEELAAMFADPEHMRFYPTTFTREQTQGWVADQLDGTAATGSRC